ncbi:hypothetical protein [uncultured Ramlibacter sp.]|uniref:hypothetical protein n=1 Tax=uncultured Ramlibacter sp. TaxID=260755 RepID=UPI0026289B6C|nr:hypothetical protein [uncultured Ramlibacter sp.]
MSVLLWMGTFLMMCILAFVKEGVLPAYFFFDSYQISTLIAGGSVDELAAGESFGSAAAFYNILGLTDRDIAVPAISVLVILGFFLHFIKRAKADAIAFSDFVIFGYFCLLLIVYATTFSKDFIVLFLLIGFVFLERRGVIGLAAWSALALVYAYYFRAYWSLVIIEFWGLYFVMRVTRKLRYVFIAMFFSLLVLSFAMQEYLGFRVDYFRYAVNQMRLREGNVNANTMIMPWLPGGDVLTGWVNVSLTLITLILPIPLLLLLTPYYLVLFTLTITAFVKFFRAIRALLRQGVRGGLINYAVLILAFMTIQSIFEPDYGSYARHLAPFYPLFISILFSRVTLGRRDTQPVPFETANSANTWR